MPLIIEGGRVPPRWAERKSCRRVGSGESYGAGAECVRIAFLNNMPDAALEDTEMQFFELLDAASGEIPVRHQALLAVRSSSRRAGRAASQQLLLQYSTIY